MKFELTPGQERELRSAHIWAQMHQSQLQKLADRCVQIVGMDDDMSYEPQVIRSIVDAGISPEDAVARINRHRENIANRKFDEAAYDSIEVEPL